MARTVPTEFPAIMKAESAVSRFNWPEAACFCAVRWVTLRKGVVLLKRDSGRELFTRACYLDRTKPRPGRLNKSPHTVHAIANRHRAMRRTQIDFASDL